MENETNRLYSQIRELILSARKAVSHNIDAIQVFTNFETGRLIVQHEQKGSERAEYGKQTLKELSERLRTEFGRGYSLTNLKLMRRFYLMNKARIGQTASDQLPPFSKGQTLSDQLTAQRKIQIAQTVSTQFTLSWSHYVFLMAVDNAEERAFYEIEAAQQNWSIRELKRQFNSGLYERLALSRDKEGVRGLAQEGQIVSKPKDLLKDPYVLEFLGLDEKAKYSESDLEIAIINKLEHFLLELGKGFLFEARQKRFTFDEDHFFIDLVFYNRLLRCYVLIDLKIGKLTHQDLGQMQMYVNFFDRYVRLDDEHPTVGIILCKKKHDALVEITLPEIANIHASEYQLYLPSKEELKQKLMDWTREMDDGE
jgi:predicted nuclease of restriction endonuclease-like (RecB) superfamily